MIALTTILCLLSCFATLNYDKITNVCTWQHYSAFYALLLTKKDLRHSQVLVSTVTPSPSFANEIAQLNKSGLFIETVLQLLTASPANSTEYTIRFGSVSFSIASSLLKLL
jgi:hypothetical protein